MTDYTFETLNDKDFEVLVRGLLQAEWNLRLEAFKSGKDEGIDLRFSTSRDNPNEVVVQAKHWRGSGFAALLRQMATKERAKVAALGPSRYVLATSVPLSPHNKREIERALRPFIISSADILGRDDLNNLLGKFPEVEARNHKLWLSSTNVLQQILNNGVKGRSDFIRESIVKKACLFVPTASYPKAVKILNERHVLLIVGVPGVGKTTLADILTYRMLSDGFELVAIDDDFRDGEDVFTKERKQLFYFDDFLGSNYLDLVQSRGSGSQIERFIERVRGDKTKRMILTTRATILNQALAQYDHLNKSQLTRSEFELKLNDYSRLDKAKILYNHLQFSALPEQYVDLICSAQNYLKVIDHRNYNPRIVEFITDESRLSDVQPAGYLEFIATNLDRPEAIWESAFENQIDRESRLLLMTMFSLGGNPSGDVLQRAYESRLSYESRHGGLERRGNSFHRSIRLLLGGFVECSRGIEESGSYSFVNPSIIDFFLAYVMRDGSEQWRILEAAVYVEQLDGRFGTSSGSPIRIGEHELRRYRAAAMSRGADMASWRGNLVELRMAYFLLVQFDWSEVSTDVTKLLDGSDVGSATYLDFRLLGDVIEMLSTIVGARDVLIAHWDNLILALFRTADDEESYKQILDLFDRCGVSYQDWVDIDVNRHAVQVYVDSYWSEGIEQKVIEDSRLGSAVEEAEALSALEIMRGEVEALNQRLGVAMSPAFSHLEEVELDNFVYENRRRLEAEDYRADEMMGEADPRGQTESDAIQDLFTR